ncbi:unnamed protein product, partial [Didymodactylos carnosus]
SLASGSGTFINVCLSYEAILDLLSIFAKGVLANQFYGGGGEKFPETGGGDE